MRVNRKSFDGVSRFALTILVALIIFSIFANSFIMVSSTLKDLNFPSSGTFGMLFDYSANIGHPAKMMGQAISNAVAYAFMLAGVIIFILSLALVRHDKVVKAKCAILALALFVPATLGLTGGVIDFFAHGFAVLNTVKGLEPSLIMGCYIVTLLLDVSFLVLTVITLVMGIGTAVKVRKGYVIYEAKPREVREDRGISKQDLENEKEIVLEEVRRIVKEELAKLDRVAIVKEVEKVVTKEVVKPVKEKVEEPVEEVDEEGKKLSIQRIPFANKIVKADKELQEKYNEIKSELLAYGASSRVSVGGDTFRLHRKPYVKITLIGKTLKVYFALDPKDFVDSPIPVIDSSDKVAYEEIPALLKVKSNLSVKRAKDLAELAFAKDGIKKEKEAEAHNWVKDIRAELKAKK